MAIATYDPKTFTFTSTSGQKSSMMPSGVPSGTMTLNQSQFFIPQAGVSALSQPSQPVYRVSTQPAPSMIRQPTTSSFLRVPQQKPTMLRIPTQTKTQQTLNRAQLAPPQQKTLQISDSGPWKGVPYKAPDLKVDSSTKFTLALPKEKVVDTRTHFDKTFLANLLSSDLTTVPDAQTFAKAAIEREHDFMGPATMAIMEEEGKGKIRADAISASYTPAVQAVRDQQFEVMKDRGDAVILTDPEYIKLSISGDSKGAQARARDIMISRGDTTAQASEIVTELNPLVEDFNKKYGEGGTEIVKIEPVLADAEEYKQDITTYEANLAAYNFKVNAANLDIRAGVTGPAITATVVGLNTQKEDLDKRQSNLTTRRETLNQQIETTVTPITQAIEDKKSAIDKYTADYNTILYGVTDPTKSDIESYNLREYGVKNPTDKQRGTSAEEKKLQEMIGNLSTSQQIAVNVFNDSRLKSEQDVAQEAYTSDRIAAYTAGGTGLPVVDPLIGLAGGLTFDISAGASAIGGGLYEGYIAPPLQDIYDKQVLNIDQKITKLTQEMNTVDTGILTDYKPGVYTAETGKTFLEINQEREQRRKDIQTKIRTLETEREAVLNERLDKFKVEPFLPTAAEVKTPEKFGELMTGIETAQIEREKFIEPLTKDEKGALILQNVAISTAAGAGLGFVGGGGIGAIPGAGIGLVGGIVGAVADIETQKRVKRATGDLTLAQQAGLVTNILTDVGVSSALDIGITGGATFLRRAPKAEVAAQNVDVLGSKSFNVTDELLSGGAESTNYNFMRVSASIKKGNKTIEQFYDILSTSKTTSTDVAEAIARAESSGVISPETAAKAADESRLFFGKASSSNLPSTDLAQKFIRVSGESDVIIRKVGKLSRISDSIADAKIALSKKSGTQIMPSSPSGAQIIDLDTIIAPYKKVGSYVQDFTNPPKTRLGRAIEKVKKVKRKQYTIDDVFGTNVDKYGRGDLDGFVVENIQATTRKFDPLTGKFSDPVQTITSKISGETEYVSKTIAQKEGKTTASISKAGKVEIGVQSDIIDDALTIGRKVEPLEATKATVDDIGNMSIFKQKQLPGSVDLGSKFDLDNYVAPIIKRAEDAAPTVQKKPLLEFLGEQSRKELKAEAGIAKKEAARQAALEIQKKSFEKQIKNTVGKIAEEDILKGDLKPSIYGYQVAVKTGVGKVPAREVTVPVTRSGEIIGKTVTDYAPVISIGNIPSPEAFGIIKPASRAATKTETSLAIPKSDFLAANKSMFDVSTINDSLVKTDSYLTTKSAQDYMTAYKPKQIELTKAKTGELMRQDMDERIATRIDTLEGTRLRIDQLEDLKLKTDVALKTDGPGIPGVPIPGFPLVPFFGFPLPGSPSGGKTGRGRGRRGRAGGRARGKKPLIQIKSSLFRKFAFGEKDFEVDEESLALFKKRIGKKGTFFGYDSIPTEEQMIRAENKLWKSQKETKGLKGQKSILNIRI